MERDERVEGVKRENVFFREAARPSGRGTFERG
jgi:hypothetical protein